MPNYITESPSYGSILGDTPEGPPVNGGPMFLGQVPRHYYDELFAYEHRLSKLPEGSDQWQRAQEDVNYQRSLVRDVEIGYSRAHQKFLDSGLTPEEYAQQEFRKYHAAQGWGIDWPSGWREYSFVGALESAFDGMERAILTPAETIGLPLGATDYSIRKSLDRSEAIQREFDKTRGGWGAGKILRRGAGDMSFYLTSALPAGPWGAIANASLDSFHSGALEAEELGVTGGAKWSYAATQGIIEGGITALFNRIGLPGIETHALKMGLNKQVLAQIAQEIPEELAIAYASEFARQLHDVNPMDLSENWSRIAREVALQTIGTVGMTHYTRQLGRVVSEKGDLPDRFREAKEIETGARRSDLQWEIPDTYPAAGRVRPTPGAPMEPLTAQSEMRRRGFLTPEGRVKPQKADEVIPVGIDPDADLFVLSEEQEAEWKATRKREEQRIREARSQMSLSERIRLEALLRQPAEQIAESVGYRPTLRGLGRGTPSVYRRVTRRKVGAEAGELGLAREKTVDVRTKTEPEPERVRPDVEVERLIRSPDFVAATVAPEPIRPEVIADAILRTDEDVADWLTRSTPERVTPSRSDFEALGVPNTSSAFRQRVQDRIAEMQDAAESESRDTADPNALPADITGMFGMPVTQEEQAESDPQELLPEPGPALTKEDIESRSPGFGFGLPQVRPGQEPVPLQGNYAAPTEEQERRITESPKLPEEAFVEQARTWGDKLKRLLKVREYWTGMWEKSENAPFSNQLKQIAGTARWAADQAHRVTAHVLEPLPDATHKRAFEKVLGMRDMTRTLERDPESREYTFWGFDNAEDAIAYHQQLEAAAKADDATVGEALRRYERTLQWLQSQLVRIGRLDPEALKDKSYWHREILAYKNLNRMLRGGTLSNPRKSFEIARQKGKGALPEGQDPSVDYMDASYGWMFDAIRTIRQHETVNWFIGRSGRYQAEMMAEAERRGMDPNTWADLLPEFGLDVYNITSLSHFNVRRTVPEEAIARFTEFMQNKILGNQDFTEAEINEFLVQGMNAQQIIVPADVKPELLRLDQKARKTKEPWEKYYDKAFSWYKEWLLHNPSSIVPYNFRNFLGDAEALWSGNPQAIGELPSSFRAVMRSMRRPHQKMDKDLADAMKWGAVGASFTDIEVEQARKRPTFKRFGESKGAFQTLRGWASDFSLGREAVVRLAAYKAFKKKLQAGTIKDYGASKKSSIDAIKAEFGVEAAAAQMSRDLLLDYADITQMGQFLRMKAFPFYSFIETNMRRQTRLLANNIYALPKQEFARQRQAGATTTQATGNAALASAIALGRQSTLMAGIFAWNLFAHRDEWEDLSPSDRKGVNLIIGRNQDGTINMFRRISAVGDFGSFFGIPEALVSYGMYQDEKISGGEFAENWGKAAFQQVIDAMGPGYKGFAELASGKSYWPDFFNPRAVNVDEHLASQVAMDEEYKFIKGFISEDGSRPRPYYWERYFLGVTDPHNNALSATYDTMDRYLTQQGKPREPSPSVSRWRNFRAAAVREDYEQFAEVLRDWEADGRGYKEFVEWTKNLDPLMALRRLPGPTQKNINDFLATLDNEELRRVDMAREYAYTLQSRLLGWYRYGQ